MKEFEIKIKVVEDSKGYKNITLSAAPEGVPAGEVNEVIRMLAMDYKKSQVLAEGKEIKRQCRARI